MYVYTLLGVEQAFISVADYLIQYPQIKYQYLKIVLEYSA